MNDDWFLSKAKILLGVESGEAAAFCDFLRWASDRLGVQFSTVDNGGYQQTFFSLFSSDLEVFQRRMVFDTMISLKCDPTVKNKLGASANLFLVRAFSLFLHFLFAAAS